MPRFSDQWVVDKTMFDYVQGGSCACCGFPHLFAPGGLEGMINSMSDLETDAARQELNAAKASPWPPELRDSIWGDRLLLRYKMKKEMGRYRDFLEGVAMEAAGGDGDVDAEDAIPVLREFCMSELSLKQLRGIFQLPRSELTEQLKSRYKMCSAYAIVFCGVVEQVANFRITRYGPDARRGSDGDDSEEVFEKELRYAKVGPGFTINVTTGDGGVDGEVLTKFLRRAASLAGPTLLARAPRTCHKDDDSDEEMDGAVDDASDEDTPNTASFRSDRRVARLLIARYWTDRLIEKYNEAKKTKDVEMMGM